MKMSMTPTIKLIAAIALSGIAIAGPGCSRLSPEAREITGRYFIPEVSPDIALIELNDDASCIMRAVKPGVLVCQVPGTWDVRNDSLVMTLCPERLTFEGDSTLIGSVSPNIRKHVTGHTANSLTLEEEGIEYIYQRK